MNNLWIQWSACVSIFFIYFTEVATAQSYIKNAPPERTGYALVSPSQVGHYDGGRMDFSAALFHGQQKIADEIEQKTQSQGVDTNAFASGALSPSSSYSFNLRRYNRYSKTKLGAFESKNTIRQSEANLELSYKVLDTYIFGLGLGIHNRVWNPGTDVENNHNNSQLALGWLYKGESSEYGLALKSIKFDNDQYRELAVHTRHMVSPSRVAGLYVLRQPQVSCCDLSAATRYEVGLTFEAQLSESKWDMRLSHRPAFEEESEAELAKTGIDFLHLFGGVKAPAFGITGGYGFGKGKIRDRDQEYERAHIGATYVGYF